MCASARARLNDNEIKLRTESTEAGRTKRIIKQLFTYLH